MLEKIRSIICERYKISVEDFSGKKRVEPLKMARKVFYIAASRYTNEGRVRIAEFCGDRSHCTITFSIFDSNETLVDPEYSKLAEEVDAVCDIIDEELFRQIGDDLQLRITTYSNKNYLVAVKSGTILCVGSYEECMIARQKFFRRYVQRAS